MAILVGSWLFLHTTPPMFGKFLGASLEVIVWRFERRTFYTGSMRVKLILTRQEVLN